MRIQEEATLKLKEELAKQRNFKSTFSKNKFSDKVMVPKYIPTFYRTLKKKTFYFSKRMPVKVAKFCPDGKRALEDTSLTTNTVAGRINDITNNLQKRFNLYSERLGSIFDDS